MAKTIIVPASEAASAILRLLRYASNTPPSTSP